jgi:hypothetical protein
MIEILETGHIFPVIIGQREMKQGLKFAISEQITAVLLGWA